MPTFGKWTKYLLPLKWFFSKSCLQVLLRRIQSLALIMASRLCPDCPPPPNLPAFFFWMIFFQILSIGDLLTLLFSLELTVLTTALSPEIFLHQVLCPLSSERSSLTILSRIETWHHLFSVCIQFIDFYFLENAELWLSQPNFKTHVYIYVCSFSCFIVQFFIVWLYKDHLNISWWYFDYHKSCPYKYSCIRFCRLCFNFSQIDSRERSGSFYCP